ncbi:MAG: amidohydrolase [Chloroflexi bacterium]|nr:amidohydrolase [Chloroflexota bacterium]
MIVDVHSHLIPREFVPPNAVAAMTLMADVEGFLRAHEASPIDFSVLSQPLLLEARLHEGPERVLDLARRCNDFLADLVARYPDRFVALAAVWPQGGAPQVREFERCVRELGMRGAMVCPRYGDLWLDAPEAHDFLALAVELDVPVYLHPPGVTFAKPHLAVCRLDETIGRGLETTVALGRLIMTGVLERMPRLKVVASHVGGGLPSLLGRLEYSYDIRHQPTYALDPELPLPPSAYARRLWVDTVAFWPPAIRAAIDTFGTDKVLLGTDTPPLPIPLARSVEIVRELGLPAEAERAILGENAIALFRLPRRAAAAV